MAINRSTDDHHFFKTISYQTKLDGPIPWQTVKVLEGIQTYPRYQWKAKLLASFHGFNMSHDFRLLPKSIPSFFATITIVIITIIIIVIIMIITTMMIIISSIERERERSFSQGFRMGPQGAGAA